MNIFSIVYPFQFSEVLTGQLSFPRSRSRSTIVHFRSPCNPKMAGGQLGDAREPTKYALRHRCVTSAPPEDHRNSEKTEIQSRSAFGIPIRLCTSSHFDRRFYLRVRHLLLKLRKENGSPIAVCSTKDIAFLGAALDERLLQFIWMSKSQATCRQKKQKYNTKLRAEV